jgi:hypothetical protein
MDRQKWRFLNIRWFYSFRSSRCWFLCVFEWLFQSRWESLVDFEKCWWISLNRSWIFVKIFEWEEWEEEEDQIWMKNEDFGMILMKMVEVWCDYLFLFYLCEKDFAKNVERYWEGFRLFNFWLWMKEEEKRFFRWWFWIKLKIILSVV